MTTIVRPAVFEDVFQIERTLLKALAMGWFSEPIEQPYAYKKLLDLIGFRLAWVAEVDGNIVGCLILSNHYWPWNSKNWHLAQEHLWVEPEFRKGGTAAKLIACGKECARELGRKLVFNISFGGEDADLKDRFVKAQGFTYIGGRFCYDPSPRSVLQNAAE
jgi:predicted N-acetyltransferase YhbS